MDARVRTILLDEPDIARFDQADPTATPEAVFEIAALRMLGRLYPSCYAFSFKPLVVHNSVGWRPDVAIIDRNWAYWFVVEIETATHSFEKHVLPQVLGLRDGEYGEDAAAMIAETVGISPDKAATLVRYVPRYVLVVSNHDDTDWERCLSAERIQFMSIARFHRVSGAPAFLVTGLLRPAERSVGFGLVLASHQAIRLPRNEFWHPGIYRVAECGGTANWDCIIDGSMVWLTKRQGVVLQQDKTWVHIIAQDDDLLLVHPL